MYSLADLLHWCASSTLGELHRDVLRWYQAVLAERRPELPTHRKETHQNVRPTKHKQIAYSVPAKLTFRLWTLWLGRLFTYLLFLWELLASLLMRWTIICFLFCHPAFATSAGHSTPSYSSSSGVFSSLVPRLPATSGTLFLISSSSSSGTVVPQAPPTRRVTPPQEK